MIAPINPQWGMPLAYPQGLDQDEAQLNQGLEDVQRRKMKLVFEIGMQAGAALATLKANKLQLEFANRALESEIAQLRSVHVAELNAAVGSHTATIEMISKKMNAIVKEFDLYQIKYPTTKYNAVDIGLIVALSNTISRYRREDVIQYPEYRDRRTIQRRPQIAAEIFSLSDALIVRQADPSMRILIEQPIRDYEDMEREIAPISAINLFLIDRKEMMIDFHGKYLACQERVSRLKDVLDSIQSTFNKIQWKTFATSCAVNQTQWEYFKSRPRTNGGTILLCEQEEVNKEVQKIQETMNTMISTLVSNCINNST